jgi:para-aminobenzoate synthetase/4-amino-4-deoxychorismate lyase
MRYPPESVMIETAVIRDSVRQRWLRFVEPVDVLVAYRPDQVVVQLERVERAVNEHGSFAAGFIAYEAAPGFDPAMATRTADNGLPLLLFGLFRHAQQTHDLPIAVAGGFETGQIRPSLTHEEYSRAIATIRDHISLGDTYQVNYTLRLRAPLHGDPAALFLRLQQAQQAPCGAYLDIGSHAICSASPELFFNLDGDTVTCRPMKGTAPRGCNLAEDHDRMEWLRNSEKNRAENLMIVDMVRNDLGRTAAVGSVKVTEIFDVERYPTVFQMTSTVKARTAASVVDVVAALFPSASITGAPKVRTMEIIRALEHDPRGVYTGAIGFIAPGRRAHFSVAIRTAVVDRARGQLEFGLGGGIVWDSIAEDEYRECLIKARVLTQPLPAFDLLETLAWRPDEGYILLDRHLDRLLSAAAYFVRPADISSIRESLLVRAETFSPELHRVRLLLAPGGRVTVEARPLRLGTGRSVRLGLAAEPVSAEDPFLQFKTPHGEVYERALADRPDCDDVLLWNEREEVTESTVANVVFKIDGGLVTPPVCCGLLAGTLRAELIERHEIHERLVRVADLARADSMYLINSVHGWRDVTWVD